MGEMGKKYGEKVFLTAWSPIVSYNQIITGTLSESVEKYYFQRAE